MVQYICLIGCTIKPLDAHVTVCPVLTIDVYDLTRNSTRAIGSRFAVSCEAEIVEKFQLLFVVKRDASSSIKLS